MVTVNSVNPIFLQVPRSEREGVAVESFLNQSVVQCSRVHVENWTFSIYHSSAQPLVYDDDLFVRKNRLLSSFCPGDAVWLGNVAIYLRDSKQKVVDIRVATSTVEKVLQQCVLRPCINQKPT